MNNRIAVSDPPISVMNEELGRLESICRQRNWKEGLRYVLRNHAEGEERARHIIEGQGFDWKKLVPLNKTSVALDAGCGWGRNSISLARDCGQVYAMDWDETKAILARYRFEEGRFSNIQFLMGDVTTLPFYFEQDRFDFVLLIGVLHYVAYHKRCRDVYSTQLQTLKGIHSVLKKGGSLYLGVRNRFAYTIFLGQKIHTLPFLPLLPRWVANGVHSIVRRKPFTTHYYSCGGYKRLLKEAGFRDIQVFIVDNYSLPSLMIPENKNLWSTMQKCFTRMYGILARK